jgi:phage/plasmid primase-like uncharacterized protein
MLTAGEIAQSLGLRRSGAIFTGPCPACGYKGAFAVRDSDGRTLVRCHAGCDQSTVIDALRRAGLWAGASDGSPMPFPAHWAAGDAAKEAGMATRRANAEAIWRASLEIPGTLAEAYLRFRGLDISPPTDLRFAPRLRHAPTGTEWPAMLAAVRDAAGNLRAVHRTYLARDGSGKAPVEPARMTLGAIAGAAVHLAPPGSHLVVGEGVETTLSAMQGSELPGWAALSTGGIRALVLPALPLAAVVTIAADNDPPGIAAAREAAERWYFEGRTVRIALPPPGHDFNDVLMMEARDAA